jgi:hypothetical protein
MRTHRRSAVLAVIALMTSGAVSIVPSNPAGAVNAHASSKAVCPAPPFGWARCLAFVVTDGYGNGAVGAVPNG